MMFPFRWNLFGRNFAWYILYSISYDFPKGNVNFSRICSLANLMNQSILKLPMTHPTPGNPPSPPGIWLFYQNFGEIPWYFGSLDGQMRMPHTYQLVLQKVSNPSPTIQKFSHASNCLFKCKYPTKHNQNKENPFACNADQCFGMKSNAWLGWEGEGAHFGSNSQSNAWGMPGGGGGGRVVLNGLVHKIWILMWKGINNV